MDEAHNMFDESGKSGQQVANLQLHRELVRTGGENMFVIWLTGTPVLGGEKEVRAMLDGLKGDRKCQEQRGWADMLDSTNDEDQAAHLRRKLYSPFMIKAMNIEPPVFRPTVPESLSARPLSALASVLVRTVEVSLKDTKTGYFKKYKTMFEGFVKAFRTQEGLKEVGDETSAFALKDKLAQALFSLPDTHDQESTAEDTEMDSSDDHSMQAWKKRLTNYINSKQYWPKGTPNMTTEQCDAEFKTEDHRSSSRWRRTW